MSRRANPPKVFRGTNLLFHLGRHLALDDLESKLVPAGLQLAAVADREPSLAQQLPDMVHGALWTICAARLDDLWRRRGRVLLVLGGLELGGGLGRLGLGGLGHSLGVDIPRGQSLHVEGAPGDQPVSHGDGRAAAGWATKLVGFTRRWRAGRAVGIDSCLRIVP